MIDINQLELTEDIRKIPHLIKYMGSKREILDFVKESIDFLNVDCDWMCDLFSGTGVVGGTLKDDFKVHANDVQAYSSVLSHTYLLNLKGQLSIDCLAEIKIKVNMMVDYYYKKIDYFKFDYSNLN